MRPAGPAGWLAERSRNVLSREKRQARLKNWQCQGELVPQSQTLRSEVLYELDHLRYCIVA